MPHEGAADGDVLGLNEGLLLGLEDGIIEGAAVDFPLFEDAAVTVFTAPKRLMIEATKVALAIFILYYTPIKNLKR